MGSERGPIISCLLALLFGFPPLVAADASAAEREIARSAMQAGDQLRDAADLQGALQRYRSADAIMHVPTTGLAVARTEAELLMLVEARSTAMEVVNLPGAGHESAIFAQARADALELAAVLEPRVPSILVEVTPSQVAYTVELDGDALPGAANGLTLKANPGRHVIVLRAQGYQSQQRELAVNESETARLRVVLEPLPAPAPPVQPRPELAPVMVAREAPPANVATGDVAQDAEPAHSAGKTRALIGLSAGGVLLLAGAATGLASIVRTSRIAPNCDGGFCGEGNRGALLTANTLANIANITLPLGVLGISYAVYEFLRLERAAPADEQARIWVGPTTVGARW